MGSGFKWEHRLEQTSSAKKTKGNGYSSMPAEPCKDGRKLEHGQELWKDVWFAESMIIIGFYYSFIYRMYIYF